MQRARLTAKCKLKRWLTAASGYVGAVASLEVLLRDVVDPKEVTLADSLAISELPPKVLIAGNRVFGGEIPDDGIAKTFAEGAAVWVKEMVDLESLPVAAGAVAELSVFTDISGKIAVAVPNRLVFCSGFFVVVSRVSDPVCALHVEVADVKPPPGRVMVVLDVSISVRVSQGIGELVCVCLAGSVMTVLDISISVTVSQGIDMVLCVCLAGSVVGVLVVSVPVKLSQGDVVSVVATV